MKALKRSLKILKRTELYKHQTHYRIRLVLETFKLPEEKLHTRSISIQI